MLVFVRSQRALAGARPPVRAGSGGTAACTAVGALLAKGLTARFSRDSARREIVASRPGRSGPRSVRAAGETLGALRGVQAVAHAWRSEIDQVAARSGEARWIDLHEGDSLDEAQLVAWITQAAAMPGWNP